MKPMLLSGTLAVLIHAFILWSDLDRTERRQSFKNEPRRVILTLASRPTPAKEPALEPLKKAPQPAPEAAFKAKMRLSPAPEPKFQPERPSVREHLPEPAQRRAPEPETARLAPETQPVIQAVPESGPVPESAAVSMAAEEKPDNPAAAAAPEPELRSERDSQLPEPGGSTGPFQDSRTEPVLRAASPLYLDNPQPHYPALARKRGQQGTVVLEVLIDGDGRVADTRVFKSSGYASLDGAARKAVEKWLFRPGMRGEEKIDMWVKVPIRYELK